MGQLVSYKLNGAFAMNSGSKSTISKLHSVCSNESDFLEIGHGNIKLKYEVNKGKLIQYTDNKNSVFHLFDAS